MNAIGQARSFLFIPANRADFLNKAHTRGADAIIVDLEDSIPSEQKKAAREQVNSALGILNSNNQLAAVRVNGDLSNLVKDLEILDLGKLSAIVLPKVEYPGMMKTLDAFLSTLEVKQGLTPGSTKLIGMIESAEGGCALQEISLSTRRLIAIAIGSEDFSADIGCEPCEEALLGICQEMIMAARRAGIAALGFPGSIGEISDLEKLRSQISRARKMGFNGALCIHPAQVSIVNSGFGYSEAQFEWAERVVSEMKKAELAGHGVCQIDGQMIDAPVLARAHRILSARNN